MKITTAMIKELREATGAGPLECKRALEAAEGDFQRASGVLRERGVAQATKKAGRQTQAGLVVVTESLDSVCAVQVDCETDFVAGTDDFKTLTHRIADQVLTDPRLTSVEQLLVADYIDRPGTSVATVIQELIGKLGENIVVRGVARYGVVRGTVVEGYVHAGDIDRYGPLEGRLGALVELGVDDNPIAGKSVLRALARDLALHITATHPRYLSLAEMPTEELARSQELCLLKQAFVKADRLTVEQLLREKSIEIGGTVAIKRFVRFEAGD